MFSLKSWVRKQRTGRQNRTPITRKTTRGLRAEQLETRETPAVFGSPTLYPAPGGSYNMARGDFDGDGDLDVGAANFNSGATVLWNNGSGVFTAQNYTLGEFTFSYNVVAADFNSDGVADLALTNFTDIRLLLSNGSGGLVYGGNVPAIASARPYPIAAGDLNSDGKQDIVFSTNSTGPGYGIHFLAGNGNGTFTHAGVLPGSPNFPSHDLQVADVNGDGRLDVLSATMYSNGLLVHLNNGSGSFASAAHYLSGGGGSRHIAAGDMNGDGKPDVAVANQDNGTVSVLLNNGSGQFPTVSATLGGASGPSTVAIADFDLDGKNDVVAGNRYSNTIAFYAGNGSGGLAPVVLFQTNGDTVKDIVAGDFNGDTLPDIAASNQSSGTIALLFNGSNAPPVANNDSYSTNEDTPLTVPAPGVLGNDTDANGHALTASLVGAAPAGLAFNSNGSFTYTPPANSHGTVTFQYKANDGVVSGNTATVSITVNPVNDPPTANANGPYTVAEGGSVNLSAAGSSDPDGSIVAYEWDFNYDGVTFNVDATGAAPTFSAAGLDGPTSRTVALRVRDNGGATAIAQSTVNVTNVAPTLTNVALTPSINENGVATLSGTITDPGADAFTLTVNWGEGAPQVYNLAAGSTSFSVAHQYLDDNPTGTPSDVYTVTGTLSDGDGGAATIGDQQLYGLSNPTSPFLRRINSTTGAVQQTLAVTNAEALFGHLTSDTAANLYSIDGYNDSFPDRLFRIDRTTGAGTVVGPTNFNWNFRFVEVNPLNGTMYGGTDNRLYTLNPLTGAATFVANIVGPTINQTIALAIDGQGNAYTTDNNGVGLFRLNLATGQATHVGDIGGLGGSTFNDLAFDPTGTLYGAASNGVVYTINTNTAVATAKFSGNYDGIAFASSPLTVTVHNVDPVASITGGPAGAMAEGSLVSLGSSVSDVGTQDTHTRLWTVAASNGQVIPAGTGPTFSFTPADNGTYTITLTATDDDGGVDTDTRTITVTNAAPSNLSLTATPAAVNENDSITLSGSFTDPGTADGHTVTINWGDGSPDTVLTLAPGVTAFSGVPHQYRDDNPTNTPSDNYAVCVTVTDDDTTGGGGGNILLIEDQGGFGGAAGVLTAAGFSVTVVNNEFANGYANLLNAGFLAGFDFVVYGERGDGFGDVLPAAVAASLENYIQGGGDLLVTGYDTLGSPTDINLADLVRSLNPSDYVSSNPNWQTANVNHFILNGPFGDFRNLSFSATGYDDDVVVPNTAAGAVELATIPGVSARIIFTDLPGAGGSVGYWNGGLFGSTTNAQPDFSDGGNPQSIFLNWAAGVNGGGSISATTSVTVHNVAPQNVSAGADQTVFEGATVSLAGTFTDPGTQDTHALTWSVAASNGQVIAGGSEASYSFVPTDDGTYTVTFTVKDDDGGTSSDTAVITVKNAAPVLSNEAVTSPINEGGTATLTGNLADAGADGFTLTVNWGDGSAPETFTFPAGTTAFSKTHTYLNDGPPGLPSHSYPITLTLVDDDGAAFVPVSSSVANGSFETGTFAGWTVSAAPGGNATVVTGYNTPAGNGFPMSFAPVHGSHFALLESGSPGVYTSTSQTITVQAGQKISGYAFFDATDYLPFNDDGRVLLVKSDNTVLANLFAASVGGTGNYGQVPWTYWEYTFTAAGTYTLEAGVRNMSDSILDAYLGIDFIGNSLAVVVNNVAPTLALNPVASVQENGFATLTGTVSDVGTLDAHTVTINWGDGSPAQTVAVNPDTRTFTATHQYLDDGPSPGNNTPSDVYTITATATDNDGGTSVAATRTVTVSNVAPTLTGLAATAILENGTTTLTGTIGDVGTQDTFTVVIDWGNGTQTFTNVPAGAFSYTRQYLDDTPTGTAFDDLPISVTVTDDDTGTALAGTAVRVTNVAPAGIVLNAGTVDENGTLTLTGSFADPGTLDVHTVTVNWGPGEGSSTITLPAGQRTFTLSHTYLDDGSSPGNGTLSDVYPISVVVADDDTGTDTAGTSVTVSNVAPTLALNDILSIDENGVATLSGTIADVGTQDTFTLTITWGDTLSPGDFQTIELGAAPINSGGVAWDPGTRTFSVTHQYLDDNPTGSGSDTYLVSVSVTDDDTGSAVGAEAVVVSNVAPEIVTLSVDDSSIDENGTVTVSGSFTDAGTLDTHTVLVTWADGTTSAAVVNPQTRTFTASHTYLDDGPSPGNGTPFDTYAVTVTVTDDDGGSDTGGTSVTVSNVAPAIHTLTNSSPHCGEAMEGQAVTATVGFTDPGTLDAHTAVINWGDGQTSTLTQAGTGSGSITGSHVYAAGGVYTITVTLSDDDGGTAVQTSQAVVSGVGVVNGVLYVIGTGAADHVSVNKQGNGQVKVHADFLPGGLPSKTFNLADVRQVMAFLCGGDDHMNVAGNFDLPVLIDGGEGDDHLNGGGRRGILVGGAGADRLVGGTVAFDLDVTRWGVVLDEWASTRPYADRVKNLRGDSTSQTFGSRLNGNTFLLAGMTVLDDGAEDHMTGSSGQDWYFAKLSGSNKDKVNGNTSGEAFDLL